MANMDMYGVSKDSLTVAASGVLANDMDMESDTLTAALYSSPAHGSISLSANGGFTYTPMVGYAGSDSFTYRAYDGTSYSGATSVSLTVTNSWGAQTNHQRGQPQTTSGANHQRGLPCVAQWMSSV